MFATFISCNTDDESACYFRAQKRSDENRIASSRLKRPTAINDIILYGKQYRDIFPDKVRNTEHKNRSPGLEGLGFITKNCPSSVRWRFGKLTSSAFERAITRSIQIVISHFVGRLSHVLPKLVACEQP